MAYVRITRPMDFAILDKTIRIKTKTAILLIDPSESLKQDADVGLFLSGKGEHKNSRFNINGPGDYEISGVKVASVSLGDSLFYLIEADNLKLGVGRMSSILKNQDKIPGNNVSIVDLDVEPSMSSILVAEPSVVILYGQRVEDAQKSMGKEIEIVNKYSTTYEKLPGETQTILFK